MTDFRVRGGRTRWYASDGVGVRSGVHSAHAAFSLNRFRPPAVSLPRTLGWALAPLALLLCWACAPLQPKLDGFTNYDFRLRGRIGVRNGDAAFSASFDWRQAGDRFAIELWGLLGQGRTRLVGNDQRARVIAPGGRVMENAGLDELMEQALGWRAPVAPLRYWVRGRMAPHTNRPAPHAVERDAHGRLARFRQLGWTVELRGWRNAAGTEVPLKVIAKKGARRVTVVCKEWSLPGDETAN